MKSTLFLMTFLIPINWLSNVHALSNCVQGEQNCWDCGKTENDLCTARLNGTELKITGTGEMRDYDAEWSPRTTTAPWGFGYTSVSVDGVKSIGAGAFECNTSTASVTISDSVINIGDFAFGANHNLTSVILPSSLVSVGDRAFNACYNLQNIFVPEATTSIDSRWLENSMSRSTNPVVYCPQNLSSCPTYGNTIRKIYAKDPLTGIYSVDGIYYASPDAMTAQNACGANNDGTPSQKCIDDALKYKNDKAKSLAQSGSLCTTTAGCLKLMDMAQSGIYGCTTIATCKTYGDENGILFNDPNMFKNADGSYSLYDENGNLIGYKGKRIYTIKEANEVSAPTGNRVSIRYK